MAQALRGDKKSVILREFGPTERQLYTDFVSSVPTGHVIQSWEWGEFKARTGVPVLRFGVFDEDTLLATAQLTLHRIPKTSYHVGYMPKGPVVKADPLAVMPTLVKGLRDLADKYDLVFVKVEPNVPTGLAGWETALANSNFRKSPKWIFTEFNFLLDLRPNEEEILAVMHEKWRYNIRLSNRKGVVVTQENSTLALEEFIRLHKETAKRQKFLLHADQYYRDLWNQLAPQGLAYLLSAKLEGRTLGSWIVLRYGPTIYYPYGASATTGREVMPVHALTWATIKLGKSLGCESFDMWGAANPDEGKKSFIWGSHVFKQGFGPVLVHYIGTYDLVFKNQWYKLFNLGYSPMLKVLTWLR